MPFLIFNRRGQFLMQVTLKDRLTVGREGADVVVADADVPPVQAAFAEEGEAYRLLDRSGQRTLVNGKLLAEALLREGDQIGFGDCEAKYTWRPLEAPPGPDSETSPFQRAENALPVELEVVAEIPGDRKSRREIRLGERLEIGSAVDAKGLLLVAEGVSKLHARLSRHNLLLMLHDQVSTNGTWCQAGRVYEVALRLGARFQVGPFDVWVQEPPAKKPKGAVKKYLAGMHSGSPLMHKLFTEIERVAPLAFQALIHGETGTGKELVAKALHTLSHRAKGPWETVNCAMLSGDSVESKLFGHKKGAFTGAVSDRQGAFQKANGGTLFLDEIAELPPDVQAKLLRALESGEIQPVGSDDTLTVDVRVVCASHRSLFNEMMAGRFRRDLFYRLNGAILELPALRDRLGDTKLLWHTFMEELRPIDTPTTSPEVMEKLVKHDWPGNVRELKNALERTLYRIHPRKHIELDDLVLDQAPPTAEGGELVAVKGKTWEQIKTDALAAVMRGVGGNRHEAARVLDLTRSSLVRSLKERGLMKVGRGDGDDEGEE